MNRTVQKDFGNTSLTKETFLSTLNLVWIRVLKEIRELVNARFGNVITVTYPTDGQIQDAEVVLVDAIDGIITIQLPQTSASIRKITVKKIDATANVVTVAAQAAQTIDGSTSYPLAAQWDKVTVTNDGTNWFII